MAASLHRAPLPDQHDRAPELATMPSPTRPHAPPWPDPFLTPVLGTVFAERATVVQRLHPGDHLILVPDPPATENPNVWVHAPGGDLVGHLPVETGARLARWMIDGGRAGATVDKIGSEDVASWRRLIVRVECYVD